MPQTFKALATIIAWTSFIIFWIAGLSTTASAIVNGAMFGSAPVPFLYQLGWLSSMLWGVAAVVVMVLRQKMQ